MNQPSDPYITLKLLSALFIKHYPPRCEVTVPLNVLIPLYSIEPMNCELTWGWETCGKMLNIWVFGRSGRKRGQWFIALCSFHSVNIPTMADFQLPSHHPKMWRCTHLAVGSRYKLFPAQHCVSHCGAKALSCWPPRAFFPNVMTILKI